MSHLSNTVASAYLCSLVPYRPGFYQVAAQPVPCEALCQSETPAAPLRGDIAQASQSWLGGLLVLPYFHTPDPVAGAWMTAHEFEVLSADRPPPSLLSGNLRVGAASVLRASTCSRSAPEVAAKPFAPDHC